MGTCMHRGGARSVARGGAQAGEEGREGLAGSGHSKHAKMVEEDGKGS